MIDLIKQNPLARFLACIFSWLHKEMAPALLRRRIIGIAVIASVLAAVYWLAIASDRYVSEAHVIIERTDLPGGQAMDFSSLIGGAASGNRTDQLLLRDHLLSVDMLKKLDAALKLHAHYSDHSHDILSRMWLWNTSIEWFYRYYLSRVSIEFDDYAGVLIIKAEGYDRKTAHAITAFLVQEGGRFMNSMARNLAQEQVIFLEKQVADASERSMQASHALVSYQNKKGMVSPQASTDNIVGLVAKLEAQRVELETQRSANQAYLVPDHPTIIQLSQQIGAVEKQILQEKAKLTSPKGSTLNSTIEEFQELETDAAFTLDVYKTSLVALEKGRIEAARTIKKISVLQAPTEPEYALEPRRFYNTLVFIMLALLLAGVTHLIAAIVRDHKD